MNIDSSMLHTTLNLRVYPQAIIGSNFAGCTPVAILDADTATETGKINAAHMHSQVYPTIPADNQVADDFRSYQYIKLRLADGSQVIIGDAWIIPTSIEESGTGKITMVWEGATVEMLEELKRITQKNGLPASSAVYTS